MIQIHYVSFMNCIVSPLFRDVKAKGKVISMENKNLEVFSVAPVPKELLKNVLPAMAAMVMVLIYNLADTFFIGQTHDDILIAAVSLAMPVFLLFTAVGTIFGVGGVSVISRALGEGRSDFAKKVCSFCMWGRVIAGAVLSVLFLSFMDQILTMMGADAATSGPARTYLTLVSLGGIFVVVSNCYSNVVRAEGQAGKAMIVHAFLTDQTAFEYDMQFSRILLSTSFLFGLF